MCVCVCVLVYVCVCVCGLFPVGIVASLMEKKSILLLFLTDCSPEEGCRMDQLKCYKKPNQTKR